MKSITTYINESIYKTNVEAAINTFCDLYNKYNDSSKLHKITYQELKNIFSDLEHKIVKLEPQTKTYNFLDRMIGKKEKPFISLSKNIYVYGFEILVYIPNGGYYSIDFNIGPDRKCDVLAFHMNKLKGLDKKESDDVYVRELTDEMVEILKEKIKL